MKQTTALNSIAMIVPINQPDPPESAELIPAGRVTGRDGRAWNNDTPQAILAHFAGLGMELPVDVEHSTELKAPKGEPAPAAGWVKGLEMRDGAVWGRIEWNQLGRELVGGKQYRYLSPVILYNPKSGAIGGLSSVALTNRPNLNLPALNHQNGEETSPEEAIMLKALLAALGLPEDATEAQALIRVGSLKTDLETARNHAAQPSLDKYVPRADYDQVLSRATNAEQALASDRQSRLDADIEAAIAGALGEGKITPATVDYHKAQCRQEGGLERFAAFCAAAPIIGDPSGLDKKQPDGQEKALNADQRSILAKLGVSDEEFLKTAV